MYPAPMSGSPLIPDFFLWGYLGIFILFLFVFVLSNNSRRIVRSFLLCHVVVMLLFAVAAVYVLFPQPRILSAAYKKDGTIEIVFSRPVQRKPMTKYISPQTPGMWIFTDPLYATHLYRRVVFTPSNRLFPDTPYTIRVSSISNFLSLSDPLEYTLAVTIPSDILGLQSSSPGEGLIHVDTPITLIFDDPMDKPSVEQNFSIQPPIDVSLSWRDSRTMQVRPARWNYGTKYTYTVSKQAKTTGNVPLDSDVTKSFVTIGPVAVLSTFPAHDWKDVAADMPMKVMFDQPVDHGSAESAFEVTPTVEGTFSWDGNTMIFKSSLDLSYATEYTFGVRSGIQSISGLASSQSSSSTFRTQEEVFKLAVPAILQQYSLSCEIAALRMALLYRGIDISEKTLLDDVGYDPTPRLGSTWGNPHVGFVGNVNGRQMVTGYGVYWGPIERAARKYRNAAAFEKGTIAGLSRELQKNNPVVIWIYIKNGTPTYWNTPSGDKILAVPDEHAVTVVGFVGTPSNPTQFIINDPLVGQVYWNRDVFDRKWEAFSRSGVVVY